MIWVLEKIQLCNIIHRIILTKLTKIVRCGLSRVTLPGLILYSHLRHPTPILLPGKPHGRRSLVGCSPWDRQESDTTELLHFHFSLSCIGEGNGNPLQYSCLENSRDGGAWWAAVYGVAQSRTRLKRLSSSSSSSFFFPQVFLQKILKHKIHPL